jgi:hypothetical protein
MTRNIKDIAPLLADIFVDFESDVTTFDKNNKLVSENSQALGLYHKYLGLLHDSWFITTTITANKFSIILNDFTTHVFADVIVDRKKLIIDHDTLVFPIQIDFQTTNLTFNTIDEDGFIKTIQPTVISEYLYEQVISIDNDKIGMALVAWKDGINDERGQHILILFSATKIILTELQDKAWREVFSDTYDNYYKYFKTQLEEGRYLSDLSKCYELYNEYEEQLNK